ncbi:DUF6515 family protein [Paraglaciecola chathamensis]|uniref:DUF6515 family protein n=1 Tax=Paraglaciecola chathamensis TaxID=368405 RepID=UPI0026F9DF7A|nr:DUF6515 family protein [Paraglaciecola chathamensis]MDO6841713.1 DUF6515 family protein [Paraglaciecola chathamensis]
MKIQWLLPVTVSLMVAPLLGYAQHRDERQDPRYEQRQNQQQNKRHSAPVVVNKTVVNKTVVNKVGVKNHKAHKRVVYKTGAVVQRAPAKGVSLRFGGLSFIFHDGLYYRHYKQGYKVVRPPVGLTVRYLPAGYERIVARGLTYYFAQGIYYVFDDGAYRVINEPSDTLIYQDDVYNAGGSTIVAHSVESQQYANQTSGFVLGKTYVSLPPSAKLVTVSGQQYFQYRDIYFLPQSTGGEVRYLALKLN